MDVINLLISYDWSTAFLPWENSIYLFLVIMAVRFIVALVMEKIITLLQGQKKKTYTEAILTAFLKPVKGYMLFLAIYVFLVSCPLLFIATHPALTKLMRSVIVFCFIWGIYNICDVGHGFIIGIMKKAGWEEDTGITNLLSTVLHILAVLLGFVMIAKEWDYDISAFIASLGIGSLAVALAAKDSLANVFGSIVIIMDKPFKAGDWIRAKNVEGIVENVSFRSTAVRTFFQELVYIPNSLLSNTPIINFSRREKYRIQFELGLTYDSSTEQLDKVCADIKQSVLSDTEHFTGNPEVNFFAFGDSALNLRIVAYAKTGDWQQYLIIREILHRNIFNIVKDNNCSCAFPSQSIYFETPLNENQIDLREVHGVEINEDEEMSPDMRQKLELAAKAKAAMANDDPDMVKSQR